LILVVLGVLASIPALMLATTWTGFTPWHSPGELALSAIVALSVGQLWVALLNPPLTVRAILFALLGTLVAPSTAFALYEGAFLYLLPVLGELPPPTGVLAWVAAIIPVFTLAGLMVLHACLPRLVQTPTGRAFAVHSLYGFYFGTIADRFVAAVWPVLSRTLPGAKHA